MEFQSPFICFKSFDYFSIDFELNHRVLVASTLVLPLPVPHCPFYEDYPKEPSWHALWREERVLMGSEGEGHSPHPSLALCLAVTVPQNDSVLGTLLSLSDPEVIHIVQTLKTYGI